MKVRSVKNIKVIKKHFDKERLSRLRAAVEPANVSHMEAREGAEYLATLTSNDLVALFHSLFVQKLSCYHSPQLEFGLAPGSSIYFIMQSARLELARKVLFGQLGQRIHRSEYFSRYFPVNKDIMSELRFPDAITILPLSSSDTAALGLNVFGGVLDELNFMSRVLRPSRSRFTGEQEYDQAAKLHTTVVRRMKSRFNVRGKVPGKLFLISSANYPGDFIDRKFREHADEVAETGRSNIFVVRMPQWGSLPPERLSEKTFLVEVGDATRGSRILRGREEAADPESVIEVPQDYYNDFRSDLEAALRDLAGIPIGGAGAFIKRRELIEQAAQIHSGMYEGLQLFAQDAVDLSVTPPRSVIDERFLQALALLPADVGYSIHVDLALTGDSCGISVGHFAGYRAVGRRIDWSESEGRYVEEEAGMQPVVVVDGVLEVIPPKADEIDINVMGDLLECISARLRVDSVSADSFQSVALLQRMRKLRNTAGRRIRSGTLSMDTSLAPYMEVKQALRDGRLAYPDVPKLKQELRELVFDAKRRRCDHPQSGSKDLADAVAGCAYLVSRRHQQKPLGNAQGRAILAGIDAVEPESERLPSPPRRRMSTGHMLH